jgi:hypothetical protein
LDFMGSVVLGGSGYGLSSIKGMAVDNGTALCVDKLGVATVYGQKAVYFAWLDQSAVSLQPITTTTAYMQITGVYLAQAVPGQSFNLSDAWTYGTNMTDELSVWNGTVSWLEGEHFF